MAFDDTVFAGEEDDDVTYTYDPVIDVSSATVTLTFERDIDDNSADIIIADGSFDKTNGATGVIKWPFTSANLATPETYYGELKAVIDADNTVKKTVTLWIKEA